MKVPKLQTGQSLSEYAELLAQAYCREVNVSRRKATGQFFTPVKVSDFMAGLFEIGQGQIRLLDPGAGTGMLTAAFCERVRAAGKTSELTVDAYENDPNLIPYLRALLEEARRMLAGEGCSLRYSILEEDFVLENAGRFGEERALGKDTSPPVYDFVISNPPYYKLNKNSPQAVAMEEWVCGQPNIYTFFMALSAAMLKPGSEMVFITPRSFCSGLYYRKFRRWFVKNMAIRHINIFESRKQVFDEYDVLQENIIMKAGKPKGKRPSKVTVTSTQNRAFENIGKISVPASCIIDNRNGHAFIRIPSSREDVSVLDTLDRWPTTLQKMGFEISTGPVVAFRATRHLVKEFAQDGTAAPLIWMHNMQGIRLAWPGNNGKKAKAVRISDASMPILVRNRNYVLLRRFSAKEERRRLHAAVLLESDLPTEVVGLENHVNYIHRPGGGLTPEEAFGLAAILNTSIVDNYFRSLNGNTQVNATEIRSMPFPELQDIQEIGSIVCEQVRSGCEVDFDQMVAKVVGIDPAPMSSVQKGEEL